MSSAQKTAHTPGPWKIAQTEPPGDFVIHAKGIPWQLAYVPASTQIEWPLEANARLIAAAPDLLAALKTTAENIRSLGPAGALANVYAPYREWLAVVEAAIAKATGEFK